MHSQNFRKLKENHYIPEFLTSSRPVLKLLTGIEGAVFRIRIHWVRIRIQILAEFGMRGFNEQKLEKFKAEKKF